MPFMEAPGLLLFCEVSQRTTAEGNGKRISKRSFAYLQNCPVKGNVLVRKQRPNVSNSVNPQMPPVLMTGVEGAWVSEEKKPAGINSQ